MEDILEEIVGNILDEYDVDEQYIVRGEGDALIMSGMTPLDEAQEELGIVFPEEDLENYDTINGLLISRLDRIPGDDEQPEIEYLGYRFMCTEGGEQDESTSSSGNEIASDSCKRRKLVLK